MAELQTILERDSGGYIIVVVFEGGEAQLLD